MSIQSWVARKLAPTYIATPEGTHGLRVRAGSREINVYCAEPGINFGTADMEQVLRTMPNCEFVVLTRTHADSEVYAQMRECGLYVGRLGELETVLDQGKVPAVYEGREEAYVLRRLRNNPYVERAARCGRSAYRVERRGSLRPLTIVTCDDYELTADEAYQLLEEHADIDVDVLVSTNPLCRNFAPSIGNVTVNTNIETALFQDFIQLLSDPWDEAEEWN